MSSFAQIITSFERTGNFPLEANYVFATVDDLKEFYSDEAQAATLHKGLLKVVESDEDGNQALYWVTKKATNDELEFTKLVAGSNLDDISSQLDDLYEKLSAEETARENAITALWGTSDPTGIDEEYNSINDLANQVAGLRSALETLDQESVSGDDSVKEQLKAVVGTTYDDVAGYMETLPYTTITEIANTLDRFINGTSADGDEEEESETTDAIDTLVELTAFLDGYTNADTLKELLNKLWLDIQGDTLPSENFRTLRGVEDYIIEYKTATDYKLALLVDEVNTMQTGIGLNADGSYSADAETYYLSGATSVMNALRILDAKLHTYISANTPSVRNEDEAVYLSLTEELDSYVLAATLKLSTQGGNQISKKTDGLYSCIKTTYEDGVLTLLSEDTVVSQHYIGMSAIVDSATYDADNEQLVFVFKLDSGDRQTVLVPVGALIREWDVENPDTSPIVLAKTENLVGTDKLSADVNISASSFNILEKDGNTLYVRGTTDNLYHGGFLLSDYLDSLSEAVTTNNTTLQGAIDTLNDTVGTLREDLDKEIADREEADAGINESITGINQSISDLRTALDTESTTRYNNDAVLQTNIDEEIERATEAEKDLQSQVTSNDGDIAGLQGRMDTAETSLAGKIETVTIEKSDSSDLLYYLLVDGKQVSEIVIPKDKYVSDISYDADSNVITIVSVTDSDANEVTSINLTDLVDVYTANNADHTVNVAISGYEVSADVRIATDVTHNILQADATGMYVDGIASNITTDSGLTVQAVLDDMRQSASDTDSALAQEIADRTSADEALQAAIDAEAARAAAAEEQLSGALADEVAARVAADNELQASIVSEATTARAAEAANAEAISNEVIRATAAEEANATAIVTETTRATEKEADLLEKIETNATAISANALAISANEESISANASDIATLKSSVASQSLSTEETNSIKIALDKQDTGTTISADVKLDSTAEGNILKISGNGVYATVTLSYNSATNTLTFANGASTTEIQLSDHTLITAGYYDSSTEAIILQYTVDGETKSISIPAKDLVHTLNVDNSDANPIKLTLAQDSNGVDTLSASVDISTAGSNLIISDNGTLYASKSASDHTVTYGTEETTVQLAINALKEEADKVSGISETVEKLNESVSDLTTSTESKVGSVSLTKVDTLNYTLSVDDTDYGITIPESLQGVSYENNTLIFTKTSGGESQSISLTDLIDTYTAGNGLKLEDNKFSIVVDGSSDEYLIVTESGIALTGVKSAIQALTGDIATNTASIAANATAISDEVTRATAAEKVNADDIDVLEASVSSMGTDIKGLQEDIEELSTSNDGKVGSVVLTKVSDLEYTLAVDNTTYTLSIPKDQFLQNVEYQNNLLVFTFNTTEGVSTVTIDVSDLIDLYTAGNGLKLEDNKFSIVVDGSSDEYLIVTESGIALTGVKSAIDSLTNSIEANATSIAANTEAISGEVARATEAEAGLLSRIASNEDDIATLQDSLASVETSASGKVSSVTIEKSSSSDLLYYLFVDGVQTSEIVIPKDRYVSSIDYDSMAKTLTFVQVTDTDANTVTTVNLSDLIDTYAADNTGHNVSLSITDYVISADVQVATDVANNILQADSTGLYVDGSASNITTDSGKTVQATIDDITTELASKAPIDSPIFTGVAQVETSPDDNDSSQRVPSTAWVQARLAEILQEAEDYAATVAGLTWIDV